MKRVAYVCADPGMAVFGSNGAAVHVQQMVRALQAQGAQVQLFASQLGGPRPNGLEQVRVHTLSPLPAGDAAERERAAQRRNAELRRLLHEAGPFDLVYERYSLWSFAGMEAAAAAHAAGLLEVSAPLIEEAVRRRVLVDRDAAEQVARQAFGAAGAVIAVSRNIADYLQHRFPETCSRIRVVPKGIDPARFPARPDPFAPRRVGAFTIGAVGTFDPQRRLPLLLDAFAQARDTVPGARLLMTAGAPERQKLMAGIEQRGLGDTIELTEPVERADVPQLLGRLDVAVAPHDRRVDLGSSRLEIYEYMAAGVPVVASRIPQYEELIEDGVTGLLCTPGDAAAFARALELLAGNPLLRARLGSDGRAHVLRHQTWDAVVGRILGLAAALAVVPAA